MKDLIGGISLVVRRKDSRIVMIIFAVTFFLLILLIQNGTEAKSSFGFEALPFSDRLWLFLRVLFDLKGTFTINSLLVTIFGTVVGGINFSLAYTYMKLRGKVILSSGLYSGIGLILAFLGIGCVACGTAFLAVVFSFFGLSTILNILPYHGEEIAYVGLIVLSIATYTISRKVMAPNVC